jgi:hypothetical protein
LFENTRVAGTETDLNELAEKSWQEIQSAFGSGTNAAAKLTVPVKLASADFGLNLDRTGTQNSAQKSSRDSYVKSTQSQQRNWTNVFLQSQGGSVNIAQLITRLESNTGSTLLEWLRSIPKYPKAFKLKMRPINELLNLNVRNLFSSELESLTSTCRPTNTRNCIHGTTIDEFQNEFDKRLKSLEFAIEIFRHKV